MNRRNRVSLHLSEANTEYIIGLLKKQSNDAAAESALNRLEKQLANHKGRRAIRAALVDVAERSP